MAWTNEIKNTLTFTDENKHRATWNLKGFLQLENNCFLLQEDGYNIVLAYGTTKNEASWSNLSKS